jgi:thiamine-phosphate pyrophosphorylase
VTKRRGTASLPHWTLSPLYAILDCDAVTARGWAPADVCRAWLRAGVRLIQLRAKTARFGAFLDVAAEIAPLCSAAGATCIINDRADVAVLCGADGVHVGQDDLSVADARRVFKNAARPHLVGLSTHDDAQVAAALSQPISYLAIGPVFDTGSKDTGYGPVGLAHVERAAIAAHAAGLPLVAIGGITIERAPAVLAAGADAVAVIGDLLGAADLNGVEARAREWTRAITSYRRVQSR